MLKKISSTKEFEHKGGSVFIDKYSDGSFEKTKLIIEKKDGVIVLIKKDDRIAMISHYRPEFDISSLEFPGGGIDFPEPPEETAKRETKEETGIIIKNLQKIGKIFPSVHVRNWLYVFVAEYDSMGDQSTQEDEDIQVKWYTKKEIEERVANNEIISSQTIAAFSMARGVV